MSAFVFRQCRKWSSVPAVALLAGLTLIVASAAMARATIAHPSLIAIANGTTKGRTVGRRPGRTGRRRTTDRRPTDRGAAADRRRKIVRCRRRGAIATVNGATIGRKRGPHARQDGPPPPPEGPQADGPRLRSRDRRRKIVRCRRRGAIATVNGATIGRTVSRTPGRTARRRRTTDRRPMDRSVIADRRRKIVRCRRRGTIATVNGATIGRTVDRTPGRMARLRRTTDRRPMDRSVIADRRRKIGRCPRRGANATVNGATIGRTVARTPGTMDRRRPTDRGVIEDRKMVRPRLRRVSEA